MLELDHGETGARRFAALVLAVDAGARERLRLVLDGEDAEADGGAVLQRQLLQAARALAADIVVMGRLAADDAAERDIAVEATADIVAARLDGDADRGGYLEGAGHGEALVAGAARVERLDGAARQLFGDMRVIRRFDDHDMGRIGHRPPPLF